MPGKSSRMSPTAVAPLPPGAAALPPEVGVWPIEGVAETAGAVAAAVPTLAPAAGARPGSTAPPAAGGRAAIASGPTCATPPFGAGDDDDDDEACAPAAPASVSSTTSAAPTATTWPTLPPSSRIVPVLGLVMVTVALSVITSASGWSSLTRAPTSTPSAQATISPSVTPSPMSGSLNSQRAMVLLFSVQ